MIKICQTRLLKLNFEIIPKKRIFRFFAKNFRRPCMKLKKNFANFQILGPLGCQGRVVIPQNVKKVKITAPYSTISPSPISPPLIPPSRNPPSGLLGQFDYKNIQNSSADFCGERAKERDKKQRGFTFCTATAILRCTFCPALLPKCGTM